MNTELNTAIQTPSGINSLLCLSFWCCEFVLLWLWVIIERKMIRLTGRTENTHRSSSKATSRWVIEHDLRVNKLHHNIKHKPRRNLCSSTVLQLWSHMWPCVFLISPPLYIVSSVDLSRGRLWMPAVWVNVKEHLRLAHVWWGWAMLIEMKLNSSLFTAGHSDQMEIWFVETSTFGHMNASPLSRSTSSNLTLYATVWRRLKCHVYRPSWKIKHK